jgi:hypothetical protein
MDTGEEAVRSLAGIDHLPTDVLDIQAALDPIRKPMAKDGKFSDWYVAPCV